MPALGERPALAAQDLLAPAEPLFVRIRELCSGPVARAETRHHGNLHLGTGSTTKATTVDLPTNDANTPIGIYAPNSNVIQSKNAELHGGGRLELAHRGEQRQVPPGTRRSTAFSSGRHLRFYQAATGSYKECTNIAHGHSAHSGC